MCPHMIGPVLVLLKLPYPLIPPFKFDDRAKVLRSAHSFKAT